MGNATPGPWHVPKHAWFQIVPADGLPGDAAIATVYECVHSRRGRDEATANACLMAAAPDLAAVLMEYERIEAEIIFDDECWNTELPAHYYDRLIELQRKRNAALEKAGYSLEMRTKAKEA